MEQRGNYHGKLPWGAKNRNWDIFFTLEAGFWRKKPLYRSCGFYRFFRVGGLRIKLKMFNLKIT
jgi:hypothetical protein